ncbi:MAG: SurA N-terminal domain-containing protein, partial [Kingella denitrificans]
MFHAIEKYRTLSQVLLGIIGVSFVGFGIASFEIVRDNRYIVKIGDQVINRAALDEAVRNSQASG